MKNQQTTNTSSSSNFQVETQSTHTDFLNQKNFQKKAFDPLPIILKKIPKHCFQKNSTQAFLAIARDLALLSIILSIILYTHSWWVGIPFSILLGFVVGGLFVIGHDAGHGAFSNSHKINTFVGYLTTTPTFLPFHAWRLSHDVHHRYTHHIEKENAWKPRTVEELAKFPTSLRFGYRLMRSWLFFQNSVLTTFAQSPIYFWSGLLGAKSSYFKPTDVSKLRASIFVVLLYASVIIPVSFYLAGWYGFVCLHVIPQFVFYFFLSLFTLFHHTNEQNEFMSDAEWNCEQAQLGCTVHVIYPPLLDWISHDIAWHIPHHICVKIPHYHLREAHAALKAAYPQHVQEQKFTWSYVKRVLSNCQTVRSKELGGQAWMRMDQINWSAEQISPVVKETH